MAQEHDTPMAHVVPVSLYVGIWATLIICTGLTVLAASFDLGAWNIVLALGIATVKGTLVVLFFMHLRYSSRLTMVTIVAAIFFLIILFSLSMTDYLTRGWSVYGL